ESRNMNTDFPTAPLASGLRGASGGAVEKSLSASHTKILTLPSTVLQIGYLRLISKIFSVISLSAKYLEYLSH
ncbi:MAG: hypothetical protein WCV99_24790, partial [Sterolibacterium sp.]